MKIYIIREVKKITYSPTRTQPRLACWDTSPVHFLHMSILFHVQQFYISPGTQEVCIRWPPTHQKRNQGLSVQYGSAGTDWEAALPQLSPLQAHFGIWNFQLQIHPLGRGINPSDNVNISGKDRRYLLIALLFPLRGSKALSTFLSPGPGLVCRAQ